MMKRYKLIYQYKDIKMNLILKGNDELDMLKQFNRYAEMFKLPINSKIRIYIKEMENDNE